MLEIAICEDEQADRERLWEMLHTILDKYSLEQQITCYSSGEELLGADNRFDLIFMDIVMEGRNGIDIGQEIYGKNRAVKIIYQTNFNEYCMDAVNTVHAFAFLGKPLTADAVGQQIEEFLKYYWREEVKLAFSNVSYEQNGVEASKSAVVLAVSDILYFEYIKSKKKIKIVTKNTVYEYFGIISELAESQRQIFLCLS